MTKKQMNSNGEYSLKKWLGTRQGTAVISVIIAIFIWFAVETVIEPGSTQTYSVPVDFTFNDAAYKSQGLSIVSVPSKTVNVTVQGDGTVLAGMSESDILVYPDYSSIKGAGEYSLRLVVRNAGTKRFEITNDNLGFVDLVFDKFIANTYNIGVNITGVEIAEGYYMDVPVVSPQTVTLNGPENSVNRVASVVANIVLDEQRSESAIVTSRLVYLDEAGGEIQADDIVADVEQVEVTVPIYRIVELPLTVEFTNVPTGFDPAVLQATLSNKTIRIAGSSSQIDSLTSISAGIVDLSSLKLGDDVILNITLPESVKNVDGLQSVTVSFEGTSNYTTKTITVTEIQAINVPSNVEITFPSEQINSVTLVGDAQELEALLDTSVVGVVDFSPTNLGVTNGQQTTPVQIIVPSGETIFATGSYTILCDVKTDTSATTQPET